MEHNSSLVVRQLAAAVLASLLAVGAAGAHQVPQSGATLDGGRTRHAVAHVEHVQRLQSRRISPRAPLKIDRTGHSHIGMASYYANFFAGRKMADGVPMNPHGSNAASRTLPLGTVAKVTNLSTHRSAVVTIEDRGPYVRGRIVDLSPSTARKIGITRSAGLAKVRVTPLAVPPPQQPVRIASAVRDDRRPFPTEAR
jgi:rare lipoprotein A